MAAAKRRWAIITQVGGCWERPARSFLEKLQRCGFSGAVKLRKERCVGHKLGADELAKCTMASWLIAFCNHRIGHRFRPQGPKAGKPEISRTTIDGTPSVRSSEVCQRLADEVISGIWFTWVHVTRPRRFVAMSGLGRDRSGSPGWRGARGGRTGETRRAFAGLRPPGRYGRPGRRRTR